MQTAAYTHMHRVQCKELWLKQKCKSRKNGRSSQSGTWWVCSSLSCDTEMPSVSDAQRKRFFKTLNTRLFNNSNLKETLFQAKKFFFTSIL